MKVQRVIEAAYWLSIRAAQAAQKIDELSTAAENSRERWRAEARAKMCAYDLLRESARSRGWQVRTRRAEEKLREAEGRLREVEAERDELVSMNGALADAASTLRTLNGEAQADAFDFEEQAGRAVARLEEVEKALRVARDELKAEYALTVELREERDKWQAKTEEVRATLRIVSEERERLKERAHAAELELDELRAKEVNVGAIIAEASGYQLENRRLTNEILSLTSDYQTQRGAVEKLRAERQELRERVKMMERTLRQIYTLGQCEWADGKMQRQINEAINEWNSKLDDAESLSELAAIVEAPLPPFIEEQS